MLTALLSTLLVAPIVIALAASVVVYSWATAEEIGQHAASTFPKFAPRSYRGAHRPLVTILGMITGDQLVF